MPAIPNIHHPISFSIKTTKITEPIKCVRVHSVDGMLDARMWTV